MKELINNELAQLQKDLENLQSAAKMISEAGTASNSVIEETKSIHAEFSKNIDKLTDLYTKFLNEANKQTSDKQQEMINHLKSAVSEQSKVFDNYTKLVETANQNTSTLLNKSISSQESSISKLVTEAEKKFDDQNNLLKSNAEKATKKIEEVSATYIKQSAETDKLLNSYLELAQSTEVLSNKISSIDFPARLERLNTLIENFTTEQSATNQKLDEITKTLAKNETLIQAKKNNSSLKTLKFLVWILFLLALVATGALVYLAIKWPDVTQMLFNK